MRIYAIWRTESKGFLVCCLAVAVVVSLSKVLTFSRWIGTVEQTSDIIRYNSIRCSSCVKLKNIGKSFMMLLLKMDLILLSWGFVRWLWFLNQPSDFPKQTHALINQEILMYSWCVNLKQIGVAFRTLWLKNDLSELYKHFDSRHRFRFSNSTQIFSKESYTWIQQKMILCS